jgi:hypothetical protein
MIPFFSILLKNTNWGFHASSGQRAFGLQQSSYSSLKLHSRWVLKF